MGHVFECRMFERQVPMNEILSVPKIIVLKGHMIETK